MEQAPSITITASTIANARADMQRLNGTELHNEEQRCQIKRSRLEAERARVTAFIETWELAQRFNAIGAQQDDPDIQIVPIDPDRPNGVKFIAVGSGSPSPRPGSSAEVPLRDLVVMALEQAVHRGRRRGLKPRAVIDFVIAQRRSPVPRSTISSAMWRMAQDGEIEKRGTRYWLSGVAYRDPALAATLMSTRQRNVGALKRR